MKTTGDKFSIGLVAIDKSSTTQLAATGKSSTIDSLFTKKSRDIKGVSVSGNKFDNVNAIDTNSTRSIKIKFA